VLSRQQVAGSRQQAAGSANSTEGSSTPRVLQHVDDRMCLVKSASLRREDASTTAERRTLILTFCLPHAHGPTKGGTSAARRVPMPVNDRFHTVREDVDRTHNEPKDFLV